jgi:hypothetical protein
MPIDAADRTPVTGWAVAKDSERAAVAAEALI